MYLQFERLDKAHTATSPVTQGTVLVLFFILIHIPLAFLMRQLPEVATLHALLVLLLGLLWAANGQFHRASYAAAYIVGAEVLWRINEAGVFWEYGKYAMILVLLVALV